jgi:hypothetical protein
LASKTCVWVLCPTPTNHTGWVGRCNSFTAGTERATLRVSRPARTRLKRYHGKPDPAADG